MCGAGVVPKYFDRIQSENKKQFIHQKILVKPI